MSLVRQLPEFVSGLAHAKTGKWRLARPQFTRCIEIMNHANAPNEAALAGLYSATCDYYGGNGKAFADSYWNAQTDDPIRNIGLRYSVATQLTTASEAETIALKELCTGSQDPYLQLTAGIEPSEHTYAHSAWKYVQSKGETDLKPPSSALERITHAYALLSLADLLVNELPKANVDGIDVSGIVEKVSKALKAGEAVAAPGGDLSFIGKWFIARSLVLRGRVFEFNANALMAEGMYRAAVDVSSIGVTPRVRLVNTLALNHLGDLLLKWERREREGEQIKTDHPLSPDSLKNLNVFVLEPTLEELSKII